MLWQR